VEDHALEKKNFKKTEKIRDFSSCYRVLFIVDEEDTRGFKSGMISSSDRATLSLRFDRDNDFFFT
jgi:hypothetical protein